MTNKDDLLSLVTELYGDREAETVDSVLEYVTAPDELPRLRTVIDRFHGVLSNLERIAVERHLERVRDWQRGVGILKYDQKIQTFLASIPSDRFPHGYKTYVPLYCALEAYPNQYGRQYIALLSQLHMIWYRLHNFSGAYLYQVSLAVWKFTDDKYTHLLRYMPDTALSLKSYEDAIQKNFYAEQSWREPGEPIDVILKAVNKAIHKQAPRSTTGKGGGSGGGHGLIWGTFPTEDLDETFLLSSGAETKTGFVLNENESGRQAADDDVPDR